MVERYCRNADMRSNSRAALLSRVAVYLAILTHMFAAVRPADHAGINDPDGQRNKQDGRAP